MVNQVGGNDSLIFDGSSVAVGPDGAVVAQAASFAEDLVVFSTVGEGEGKGAIRGSLHSAANDETARGSGRG